MDLKGLRGVCKGKNFHNIVLCKKISKMDEKRGGRGISPFTYSLIQYLFYCIVQKISTMNEKRDKKAIMQ